MENIRWTDEEMILAADLALARNWRGVNATTPEVVELSKLLRSAKIHPQGNRNPSFRSVGSVNMKVNNLIASLPGSKGAGLRSSRAEKVIVRRFLDDPIAMIALAADIRRDLQ